MFCNQCGHENQAGSRFCSACGAALGQPRPEDTTTTMVPVVDAESEAPAVADAGAEAIDLAPGTGMLVVKRGPNAGSRFVLEGAPVQAGRHPKSDIFLDDITVSRRHAEFVPASGGYAVRDVGSLNGTYLNRERIEADAPLANGDEVQIGKFKLVFLAAGPAQP